MIDRVSFRVSFHQNAATDNNIFNSIVFQNIRILCVIKKWAYLRI